jgi:hypothetical protein
MMSLAVAEEALPQVRSIAYMKLDVLKNWLSEQIPVLEDENQKAHYFYAIEQINLFQENPEKAKLPSLLPSPPGAPIGTRDEWGAFFKR